MSASLFRNFTTLLLWEAQKILALKEAVLEPASSVPSETFGQEDDMGQSGLDSEGFSPLTSCMAWIEKDWLFFGTMKFNAKKQNIVLLTAKHGSL